MPGLVDEPLGCVVRGARQELVRGSDRGGIAGGAQEDEGHVAQVHAQVQERVVQLAEGLEDPPVRALRQGVGGSGRARVRRVDRERRGAVRVADLHRDVLVRPRTLLDGGLDRLEDDPLRPGAVSALLGGRAGLLGDDLVPLGERRNAIHEVPLHGALALDALGDAREHVAPIATDLALVRDAGESTGTRKDAQERHLGERDGAVAVVDEEDPVAGERELVPAARRGAVERGDEALVRVRRCILDPEARLVGVLAEVDLEGVRAAAEHHDVRAGAEHPVEGAGHDDGADLGVLEAQALDRVAELDVHRQVVAVELELVRVPLEPAEGLDGHLQVRDVAVDLQAPVAVLARVRLEVDPVGGGGSAGGGGRAHGRCGAWRRWARDGGWKAHSGAEQAVALRSGKDIAHKRAMDAV